MSEETTFYSSWLGCPAFGASAVKFRDPEPVNFNPLDISGCAIWMDANDNASVNYTDVLEVLSWNNKGYLGGSFDASGIGLVLYGDATQNALNTVSFRNTGFLQGNFALNFQNRSIFVVTRPNSFTDGSANSIFSSDTTNCQELFFLKNGTWTWFEGKHPSPIPEIAFETATDYTGYANLAEFINATDLSDNWHGINGVYIPPIYESAASYNTSNASYFLGNIFNNTPYTADIDFCEIIIYNTALSASDRIQVEYYLQQKWAIQEPPPPPPPAFNPKDISGLYIWFDANQDLTNDESGYVLSWKNQGLSGGFALSNSGIASSLIDITGNKLVLFPANGTDLAFTTTLPYLDRTHFVVFKTIADLTAETYPYISFIQCYEDSGLQTGVSWDSNTSNYYMTMCQQGQNCPVVGVPANLNNSNYSLAIFQNTSADYTQNKAYFNGGSNLNIGSNAGNLFLQTETDYFINNANISAPANITCEILEYGNLLSSSNISTVADYLVNKYAISSFTTIS